MQLFVYLKPLFVDGRRLCIFLLHILALNIMEQNVFSPRKTARSAGLLYLILAVSGFFMYIPSMTIVRDDAVATADKVLGHELLFRAGIVLYLVSATTFLLLAFVLYKLFKQVNPHQARILFTKQIENK